MSYVHESKREESQVRILPFFNQKIIELLVFSVSRQAIDNQAESDFVDRISNIINDVHRVSRSSRIRNKLHTEQLAWSSQYIPQWVN